jgi:hypothetical protein
VGPRGGLDTLEERKVSFSWRVSNQYFSDVQIAVKSARERPTAGSGYSVSARYLNTWFPEHEARYNVTLRMN